MSMIDILLASFNGEPFLREQWRSILAQSHKDWRLLVGDDGSSDCTIEAIQQFIRQEPSKVQFSGSEQRHCGACGNFAGLLEKSTADYIMFCDQDDVWLPDKIGKTFTAMQAAERKYGVGTPLLVHTDLKIVDADLRPLAPSFWRYQHLSPQQGSQLHRLLTQNVVTGCTVMINRPLAKLATPIPDEAIMHDWWLALIAALFGRIIFLDEPTILYRQHLNNSVGAKRWGLKRIIQQAQYPGRIRKSTLRTIHQAQAILDRYRNQIPTAQQTMIEAYSNLLFMPKIECIRTIIKYHFFRQGMIRTIGFLASLIMVNRFHK